MGGDFAPKTTVEGAVQAAQEFNIATILVGNESVLAEELSSYNHSGLPIEIRHAPEIITMDESPLNLIRKKRHSSIRVAFDLVKSGLLNSIEFVDLAASLEQYCSVEIDFEKALDSGEFTTLGGLIRAVTMR